MSSCTALPSYQSFSCDPSVVSRFSQVAPRFSFRPLPADRAMDSSHHPIQYHLARALMHLNQLAAFIPSFEYPDDRGSNSTIPRHHGQSSARHLHTFVPLPTEPRPLASLVSHGGLPSHFVMNPEPRLRAMSYRSLSHVDTENNRAVSIAPPSPHEATRTDEDHHSAPERPAPRAKQASRSMAPRSRTITYHPAPTLPEHHSSDTRSAKRPRNTYMVETVNRFGSPPNEGASSHARSTRHSIPQPEADPPTIRHNLADSDSEVAITSSRGGTHHSWPSSCHFHGCLGTHTKSAGSSCCGPPQPSMATL